MLLYDDINRKGFEGDLVVEGFTEFLRNLLVCKDEKVAGLLEVVESFKDKYIASAKKTTAAYIISALNILNETSIHYKAARNKRLHVELALIKLTYLQQALELTATGDGISKKKLIDTVKPVTFKGLSVIEYKKQETSKQGTSRQETSNQGTSKQETPAKLMIETGAEESPSIQEHPNSKFKIQNSKQDPEVPAQKPTGKLGALGKIRQQYSNGNGNAAVIEIIPLNTEALQKAWNDFTIQLKEAKNPAGQSFDLAELRIKDEGSFDIVTPNNLQLKFIEQERIKLSEYLQQLFNNRALTFSISIEEKMDLSQKVEIPLNTKQQFLKIAEQYPLVKELKDKLRLELDY